MNKNKILSLIKIFLIAIVLIAGLSQAQYTAPPTLDNPINVGPTDQVKPGKLGVDFLRVFGNANLSAATGATSAGYSGFKIVAIGVQPPALSVYGSEYIGAGGALTISNLSHTSSVAKEVCANASGTLVKCPKLNGQCGNAASASLTGEPSDNLCDIGIPSKITGSNPWNWTCTGFYGLTQASTQVSCTGSEVVHGSEIYLASGKYTSGTFSSGAYTTWTVPANVTSAVIQVYGAGGGGGGGGDAGWLDAGGGGGGGGNGGYSQKTSVSVTPGEVYTITVGGGGGGGTASGPSPSQLYGGGGGGDGGASSIKKSNGTIIASATGGSGGYGGGLADGTGANSAGGGTGGAGGVGTSATGGAGQGGASGDTDNEYGGYGGQGGNGAGGGAGGQNSNGSTGADGHAYAGPYNIAYAGQGGGGGGGAEGQTLASNEGGWGGKGTDGAIGIFY